MQKKLLAKMLVFLMSLTIVVNGMPLNVFAEDAEGGNPSQREISADADSGKNVAEGGAADAGSDAEEEDPEDTPAKGADETGDADSRSQEEEAAASEDALEPAEPSQIEITAANEGAAAEAGAYTLKFKPIGSPGWADFYAFSAEVTMEDGTSQRFELYTYYEQWSIRTINAYFESAPAKLTITCSYKYEDPDEDFELLTYETAFPEFCDREIAAGISPVNAPGQLREFCEYTIERHGDGQKVTYIDAHGNPRVCENCREYDGETLTDGWYIIRNDTQIPPYVMGDVNLILGDDARCISETMGAEVLRGSLTIWCQEKRTGEMKLWGNYTHGSGTSDHGQAGIQVAPGASLTINGGIINVKGSYQKDEDSGKSLHAAAAGIGGGTGSDRNCGSITINGGTVTAEGLYDMEGHAGGAGIGGGEGGSSGSITINGGVVKAIGGRSAAGIGGGSKGNSGTVTITNGLITAEGGEYGGAGIGGGAEGTNGTINISGGIVKATHYQKGEEVFRNGTGIGAGTERDQGGAINISGGTVYAEGSRGAGIGGGGHNGGAGAHGYKGGTVNITGGKVFASSINGAGIGGGGGKGGYHGGDGGTVTIDGGVVVAVSCQQGAGIGGGNDGRGGTVIINGGEVLAVGGNSKKGVFDDFLSDYNDDKYSPDTPDSYKAGALVGMIIGQLLSSGEWAGAGIGGGDDDDGGTVRINGGIVTASGGKNGTSKAIGYGDGGDNNGSISVYETSKTTYGSLNSDGGKNIEGVVYGGTAGAQKAQSSTYVRIEPDITENVTVTFDVDDRCEAPEAQTLKPDQKAARPQTDPEAEGFVFGGWYSDDECTEAYDFSQPVEGDITIHAKWLPLRALKVRADWNGAKASDLPESLVVTYTLDNVKDGSVDDDGSTYHDLTLNAENNWTDVIQITDESVLKMKDSKPDGFRNGKYTFSGNMEGSIELPQDKYEQTALNIRSRSDSGLSQADFDAAASEVRTGKPVITINKYWQRIYKVKKIWDLPPAQTNFMPDELKTVLQHKEGGEWKTIDTITLKKDLGEDASEWTGSFDAVDNDGKEPFADWRVRELDKDGNVVLSNSDEGGSDKPKADLVADPYTGTKVGLTYDVSYAEDKEALETTVTNKAAGTICTVKINWLDYKGNADEDTPDSVRTVLYRTEDTADGKKLEPLSGSIHLDLNEANGWTGSFEGRVDEGPFEAREMYTVDGYYELVQVEGDEGTSGPGKAIYTVTKDGKTVRYEYDVTLEVDTEKNITTITNKKTGVIYSVSKEWNVPENSPWPDRIHSVYAALQHRTTDENGNETWETVKDSSGKYCVADVDSALKWKEFFPVIKIDDSYSDDDYRVREFIEHVYDSSQSDGFPADLSSWQKITYFDPDTGVETPAEGWPDSFPGRLLLAEDDSDNTQKLAPVFFARNRSHGLETTSFTASYSRDADGNFVITNTQAGILSVKKKWEAEKGEAPVPDKISVVLQKNTAAAGADPVWETFETAELSEENGWAHNFNANKYSGDGQFNENDFRIRERTDGSVLQPGEVVHDPADADYEKEGGSDDTVRTEYSAKIKGKTVKVPYRVKYEQDGPVTTITNTAECRRVNIEKKWDIDLEGKDHPDSIDVAVQKKNGEKWETVEVVSLSEETEWKAEVNTWEAANSKAEFRVRELKDKSVTDQIDPDSVAKRIVYDKGDADKPKADDGKEIKTNTVTYKVSGYSSVVEGGEVGAHKTKYMVSYKSEKTDNGVSFTITNKAVMDVDVAKSWFAPGVDEGDMPDSAWLVLMCSPKAGALDNASELAGAAGVDLSSVLDYEFPVINPIAGGHNPVTLIGDLALGIDLGVFDKLSFIPKLAIAKAQKSDDADKNWKVHFTDSKYHMGIPVQYKGAELTSEILRQIVRYLAGVSLPLSFNPLNGYISIPMRAIASFADWSITDLDFSGLSKIGAKIKERDIDGLMHIAGGSDTDLMANVINVKVDIDPDDDNDPPENDEDTITIYGRKTWDDSDDKEGERPETITVRLYADGVETASVQTSAMAGWKYFFPDQQKKNDEGRDIEYTIDEDPVNGYVSAIKGYNITNTRNYVEPAEVSVTKKWNDDNDRDGLRPKTVSVRLLSNGKESGETITLSEANGWTGKFEDLDPANKNGDPISYTVEEIKTDVIGDRDTAGKYKSEISGDAEHGFVITNTHTPETVNLSGSKNWDDKNDQDGKRPESITVHLMANGTETASKTVSARDGWKWTFENVPKYEGGREISYVISEDLVDEYTSTVKGMNVTNAYTPGKTQLNVYVGWLDDGDRDGVRPDSVTLHLLADGEDTGKTLTLDEADSWSGSFTGLDKMKAGKEIKYTVSEDEVDKYSTRIIDGADYDSPGMALVINRHDPEVITISGKKVWDDDDNRDGARPESITVRLYQDGQMTEWKEVSAADDWKWEFDHLYKYRDGRRISFTVSEDKAEGYTYEIKGNSDNGFTITNTHAPGKTQVQVTKLWDDGDNEDGIRPESVTVSLLADGRQTGKTLTLTEGDDWTGTFTGLNQKSAGRDIRYTVKENATDVVTGEDGPGTYASVIAGDAEHGFVITNTHTPETVSLSGSKNWDDKNDQDGKRPESITVHLMANGAETASKTVSARDGWKWTFENVPKYEDGREISYVISEDLVDEYTSAVNGMDVTNTYTPGKTQLNVYVGWLDDGDRDGVRPRSVTLHLLADGEDTGKTLTLDEAGSWTGSFTGLDKMKAGREIKYTVSEDEVEKYSTRIINGADHDSPGMALVINRHDPEIVTISGKKVWDDDDNRDGARPESIIVRLYQDGQMTEWKEVSAADDWKWEFDHLYKYRDGRKISFTVSEDRAAGYTYEIKGNADNGFTITNTHAPGKTQVQVTKLWDDGDNRDGIRPESVTINLLADGKDTGKTLTLTEGNDWTGTFTGLDQKNAGRNISYTVKEIRTDVIGNKNTAGKYKSGISGDAEHGYVITNKHTPETVSLSGSKKWDDKNDQDGKRPESITVRLMANGTETASKTVSARDGWKWTFENVPKYEDGREISYVISEDLVDEYTSSVNGMDVTNTYTPGKTQFNVYAGWLDDGDRDGVRPGSVTLHLLADGEDTGKTLTLNEEGGWTGSFTGLDKMKAGKEIKYTVSEDEVDKYSTRIIDGADHGSPGMALVINKHDPETVTISGEKVWNDDDNRDGTRPESITVRLYQDGQMSEWKEVSAADDWKWEFDHLYKYRDGRKISFTVSEDRAAGYTYEIKGNADSGFTITNTHAPGKTQVQVTKLWVDGDNEDGIRPDSVTVSLLADGKDTGKTLTLTEGNGWTGTFAGLDKKNAGSDIRYTVKELVTDVVTGEDGPGTYASVTTGDAEHGYVITNTHTPETLNLSGSKIWNDKNDQDGKRPESITVRLMANGAEAASKTVSARDGWKWTFENVPKYSDGSEISYVISEDQAAGYTYEIKGNADSGFTITNTYAPGKTQVQVTKLWDDGENEDGIRPESVTVSLLADGKDTGKTLTLTEEDGWTGTFTGLDQKNAGSDIRYTVKEDATDVVTGEDGPETYASVTTGDAESGFVITNTHTPKPVYKITYDLNGGSFDGSTDNIVETYKAGTEISIHEAPVRAGYKFTYWKGSEYQPGDKYTVTEDHSFTAQWEKAPDGTDPDDDDPDDDDPGDDDPGDDDPGDDDPGDDDPEKPGSTPDDKPGTGDTAQLELYAAMCLMSLLILIVLISLRIRDRMKAKQ